jgi:hypothetical protein
MFLGLLSTHAIEASMQASRTLELSSNDARCIEPEDLAW